MNSGSPMGGGMNYTGNPIMFGGGNASPMSGGMPQENHPLSQGPGPVNNILTPYNSPSPGPSGGTNYAYSGQPSQSNGQQLSSMNGTSSIMGSK